MTIPIISLSSRENELESLPHYGGKDPAPAVIQLNTSYLILKNPVVHLRNQWLLPWLISISIGCFSFIFDYYKTWKSTEDSEIEYVYFLKSKYGNNYFEVTDNEVRLETYARVKNGYMPFSTYVHYRYNDVVNRPDFIGGWFI